MSSQRFVEFITCSLQRKILRKWKWLLVDLRRIYKLRKGFISYLYIGASVLLVISELLQKLLA